MELFEFIEVLYKPFPHVGNSNGIGCHVSDWDKLIPVRDFCQGVVQCLFYQSFIDLPKELDEAAIVDGAGYFRIYWTLAMPLSKPIISTAFIMNALVRWGDLLWPLMVTRGETYRPLSVGMQQLFTIQPIMWGDVFAFATIITLPILIMFLVFQKQFIESIASTGVKG